MTVARGEAFFAEPTRPKHKLVTRPAWRVLEDGFYLLPGVQQYDNFVGVVCRVKTSKTSGGKYAMALVQQKLDAGDKFVFEYQSGLIKKLSPDMAITQEQATAFGVRFGICCRCGAELTNEESIEYGMGPICRGKMGW